MSLPPNFAATLSAYENEQLYEMLANKDDYLPEAVEAARAELQSRHLAPETQAHAEHAVAARIAVQKHLQDLPLRGYQKVLLFIGSAGLLSLILIAYFSAKGQAGRVCESWRWMVLGLSFWVLFGLLMGASGSVGLALVLGFAVASGLYYTLLRPSAEDQPPQQAASSSSSRAIAGAGPDCVSCRTPLPAGAGICPHCGWTNRARSACTRIRNPGRMMNRTMKHFKTSQSPLNPNLDYSPEAGRLLPMRSGPKACSDYLVHPSQPTQRRLLLGKEAFQPQEPCYVMAPLQFLF